MSDFGFALLMLLVFGLLSVAIFKTNLPAYLLAIGFIFAVMSLLHHYAETGLRDYALYDMRDPAPRYLVYRGAVLAGGAAPLPLLALAWLYQHRLSRLGFYSVVAAVACSGLWTGGGEFNRLASYYPAYSLFSILGAADLFAVIGALLPLTLSVVALREGRPPAARAGDVRRAASALHGESDWLPISAAKLWFKQGGIVIGEACRPDLQPKQAGKAPLLRYGGNEGSGHLLVFAGSGGYKTTGTVVPSALEWRSGLVCLDPSAEVVELVHDARRGLGHRVVALNPEDPRSDSFNALDWINISTDRALLDIQAVVGWLCGETPGERHGDYFKHAARALLGCLLADIVFDGAIPPERKTLLLLRQRVSLPIPELKELLEAIYAKGSGYGFGFPAQLAGNLKDIAEKQFSGFYGEAAMGILETARDTGRKYGINLCLIYQSLGQLTQGWGPHGRQAWFDAAYLRLFSHIQDYEAAEYLSKACGEFTALGDSVTAGSGSSSSWEHRSRSAHQSTSQQQVARRLIKPEEVLQRP